MQIGIITKPQALKGQFRVKPTGMYLMEMKDLEEVIIKGKTYEVEKVILRDGFAIFKVAGIDDISQVEHLRNVPISIEDVEDDSLEEDEYYIDDMIGCKVIADTGEALGVITAVNSYGGASVISMDKDGVEVMFPHARGVILGVDTEKKVVTVVKSILEEMAL
ncbi:MAG: 16S rRNA processing protein RimM [Clostridiales bacterium]|nr:16S rRNA processing protein RimM [Clostridiales bacterium]